MGSFQLPEGTVVNNYLADKSMSLDTKGGYKSFGLGASLNLDNDKTILIIYNVNLRVDAEFFGVRLRMGNKFNRKSVLSMKDLAYGRASGYVVRVLKKGNYSFDIDFKSDSKSNFNPETADAQVISMQIIEMD